MTKPKPELTASKAAARALRNKIVEHLRAHPMQTVPDLAKAIGVNEDLTRPAMMRLVKAGLARSVRSQGKDGWVVIAHYHLVDQVPGAAMRTAAKPYQPMVKEWSTQQVRDPFHLPQSFFSRTAA
ncbi:MAG: hypothetical protein V4641_01880 [Pseudomonadota bacterium]